MSEENRRAHRDEVIAIYYQHFVAALNKFGYTKAPPSLLDLQVEMLRNGHLEVVIGICMSFFFFIDFSSLGESGIDFDPVSPGPGMRKMFQVAGFKEYILRELPRWCNNGFI